MACLPGTVSPSGWRRSSIAIASGRVNQRASASSPLSIVISVMAIGIFSAFILVDVQRIINGGETNYISATLSIYLDVYNIFVHLLSLLGLGGSRD